MINPPCFISITTIIFMATAATSHAFPISIPSHYYYHDNNNNNNNKYSDKQQSVPRNPPPPPPAPEARSEPWFRGGGGYNPFIGRFRTCDEVPGVCGGAGGAGARQCCGRTCVDVAADVFNCGRCGRRCRFGEMCCGGRCVGVFYDRDNCGSCGNACAGGGFCRYGMCDYAS